MTIRDSVIVITGAARGIGAAMARRFAKEHPAGMVVSDLAASPLDTVAAETGAIAVLADVGVEIDVRALVARAIDAFGRIDLFCSNAGILVEGGPEVVDSEWDRILRVNVQSHVYAARALLPHFEARGGGYFLQTVSAAGLLTAPGSAPYAVSKHAALAFGEWLAIHYAHRGVRVSCLCPQFVLTDMVTSVESPMRDWMIEGSIPVETVAEVVVEGLRDERFLILPHPEVAEYFRRKANDYDRWIRGMSRLVKEKGATK